MSETSCYYCFYLAVGNFRRFKEYLSETRKHWKELRCTNPYMTGLRDEDVYDVTDSIYNLCSKDQEIRRLNFPFDI